MTLDATPPNVIFCHQEGAFGTLLLKYDIANPPLGFQKQGQLDPKELLRPDQYGLQLTYQFDPINGFPGII